MANKYAPVIPKVCPEHSGGRKSNFQKFACMAVSVFKGENYSLPHRDHRISIIQIHPPIQTTYFVQHELSIITYLLQRQVKQAKLSQLNFIKLNVKE